MIFAVFDVLLAVNMCINYSFYIYICSFITAVIHYLSNTTRRGQSNKEKNEVSRFTRSKVTEGVPKFKKGHVTLTRPLLALKC